jgi:hypothetical protein
MGCLWLGLILQLFGQFDIFQRIGKNNQINRGLKIIGVISSQLKNS